METNIEKKEELFEYLNHRLQIDASDISQIQILKGGVSNRTVRIQFSNGITWVCKQALKKLRVKEDWFSHPRRIIREAFGMEYLNQICPKGSIPKLTFLDKEVYILGMEAVPEPHQNFKSILLKGEVNHDHFHQFGSILGAIHGQVHLPLENHLNVFHDTSFFETLRLEPYYTFTAERLPETASFLNELIRKTRTNKYTIVHGDFSPKNILVHRGKLILLDHEVIHFGDGTFDIGFALAHFLSKFHYLESIRKTILTGIDYFWEAYKKSMVSIDSETEKRAVHQTIACLLARVHGRSPLEYLSERDKLKQSEIGLDLIRKNPASIPELIHLFVKSF
jgi:5-methylthioribose kinase